MERFIADLVKAYESGKIDRREFCKTVTLAATVYAAGDAAKAQAPRGFKMIGINHISYTCPDYNKVRDWYISVLGMESTPGKDNGQRASRAPRRPIRGRRRSRLWITSATRSPIGMSPA